MVWKPIDLELCAEGEPVAAPMGQALVRNFDHTRRHHIYQYGGRVWPDLRYVGSPVARGVEIGSHRDIWLRILTAHAAPEWVEDDWTCRLLYACEVEGSVELYLSGGGDRPLVDDQQFPANVIQLGAGAHADWHDVPASSVLNSSGEVAVWMRTDFASGIESTADALSVSADGVELEVFIDNAAGIDFASIRKGFLMLRLVERSKGDVPELVPLRPFVVQLIIPTQTDEARLVLWPPIPPQVHAGINRGRVQAYMQPLSRLNIMALSYEFVPPSLASKAEPAP